MTQADTTRGFEPPMNTQFSVFLDNRVGKLLELLAIFDDQALRVVAISIVDTADCAIVRLITSRAVLARRLLERHGYSFSETELLIVMLQPEQSMTELCNALLRAEISIRYAYPILSCPQRQPALALHTEDRTSTVEVLKRKLFVLLGENDLGEEGTPGDAGSSDPANS